MAHGQAAEKEGATEPSRLQPDVTRPLKKIHYAAGLGGILGDRI